MPRRPDHRRHHADRAHQRQRLDRPARARHQEPLRRPRHPGRRLLPGHAPPPTPTTAGTTTRSSWCGCRTAGTAGWSSPAPRACARSTPTTSSSADWVLARGYAFAATDKGNTGAALLPDGRRPGDAIAEWNDRVTQLTVAAKAVVAQRYGRAPRRTYMAGISNGGYLVRWQLENRPGLYDGGVDWEGTLWRGRRPQPADLPAGGAASTTRPTPRPATRRRTTR